MPSSRAGRGWPNKRMPRERGAQRISNAGYEGKSNQGIQLHRNIRHMEKLLKQRKQWKLSQVAKERIIFIISMLFVFLFSYTAIDKFRHLEQFSRGIGKIPIVGGMHVWIAWDVPLAELLISALLIIPKCNRLGLQMAIGLMGVFTLYLGLMIAFAEKRLCHCGGVVESMGWVEHLLFNITFILLGGWALYLKKYNIKPKK
ncbi:MAG TPA: MauE/DoxX family redox-associated membrane protein [Pseudosphingobacterium sp.]|nr:MauE/DoxX family redox-associated membrane protein [Pseudosphingobacterium sp.]